VAFGWRIATLGPTFPAARRRGGTPSLFPVSFSRTKHKVRDARPRPAPAAPGQAVARRRAHARRAGGRGRRRGAQGRGARAGRRARGRAAVRGVERAHAQDEAAAEQAPVPGQGARGLVLVLGEMRAPVGRARRLPPPPRPLPPPSLTANWTCTQLTASAVPDPKASTSPQAARASSASAASAGANPNAVTHPSAGATAPPGDRGGAYAAVAGSSAAIRDAVGGGGAPQPGAPPALAAPPADADSNDSNSDGPQPPAPLAAPWPDCRGGVVRPRGVPPSAHSADPSREKDGAPAVGVRSRRECRGDR